MEPDDRLVIAASVLPRLVVMFIIWYLIIIVTKIEPDDLLAILVLSCLPSSGWMSTLLRIDHRLVMMRIVTNHCGHLVSDHFHNSHNSQWSNWWSSYHLVILTSSHGRSWWSSICTSYLFVLISIALLDQYKMTNTHFTNVHIQMHTCKYKWYKYT